MLAEFVQVATLQKPRPCRLCGRPAYAADAQGPAHRCCVMWAEEIAALGYCPSCAESRVAERAWQERQRRTSRL